jgi:ribonuclease inhibitor
VKHERTLRLNANRMATREKAHAHLKAHLRLPEWYGSNLDALRDCLGGIGGKTRIILRFYPRLTQELGDYGVKLLRVLELAAEENQNLQLELRERL